MMNRSTIKSQLVIVIVFLLHSTTLLAQDTLEPVHIITSQNIHEISELKTLHIGERIPNLVYLSDSGVYFGFIKGENVYIYHTETAKQIVLQHESNVSHMAFLKNETQLLTASKNYMTLWNIEEKTKTLEIFNEGIILFALSSNEQYLAICGSQNHVKVWDLSLNMEIAEPRLDDLCGGVAFSPDNKTLAILDLNEQVSLWNMENFQRVLTFDVDIVNRWTENINYGVDGKTLAIIMAFGGTLQLWDLSESPPRRAKYFDHAIYYWIFYDGYLSVIPEVVGENQINLIDANTISVLSSAQVRNTFLVQSVSPSADIMILNKSLEEHDILLAIDVASGRILREFEGYDWSDFTPQGNYLVLWNNDIGVITFMGLDNE